jgi:hypothetical protein
VAIVRNKRKVLSVEGKVKVIRQVEKKTDVCREFGLVSTTILMICKNKTKIINAFERNGSRNERFRKSERSDVDGGAA